MAAADSPPSQPYEEAFRLVLAHRSMLLAYVRAIARDPVLTEDAFSEVTVEIARAWPRFDRSRPFEPWARGVARRVTLALLRREGRQPLPLDEEVLEHIGGVIDQFGGEPELERRKEALRDCLAALPVVQRDLIQRRYFSEEPYDAMATALGRSVGALQVALHRIHATLLNCVRRKLGSRPA